MQLENSGKITIISINRTKKRISLLLSDGEEIDVNEDIILDHYLFVNKELNKVEIKEIKENADMSGALNYSYKLLSKGMYTEKEIKTKLEQRKYSFKIIRNVLTKLLKLNYLNDARYVEEFVSSSKCKGYGPNKIINTLKSKGISDKLLASIEYNEDEQKDIIKLKIPKLSKQYNKYSLKNKKIHIVNSLVSAGFDTSIIYNMIDEYLTYDAENEKMILSRDAKRIYEKLQKKSLSAYELRQSVVSYLLRKGYNYNDIDGALREIDYED